MSDEQPNHNHNHNRDAIDRDRDRAEAMNRTGIGRHYHDAGLSRVEPFTRPHGRST